jgi:polyisoprenoid-binding protein YceI
MVVPLKEIAMATRTWNIDTSHSAVHFTVRHLVIAKVRGVFGTFSGQIQLDPDDLSKSSVKVEIDAASIDTKEEKRDAHLRSADFLDVENHPKLTFVSKRVEAAGGKISKAIGDLTLHGVTKEVTLEIEDSGRAKDPWGNEKAAFEAKTRINRTDFGLKWNAALETGGVLVGEHVDISIDVEAVAAK